MEEGAIQAASPMLFNVLLFPTLVSPVDSESCLPLNFSKTLGQASVIIFMTELAVMTRSHAKLSIFEIFHCTRQS